MANQCSIWCEITVTRNIPESMNHPGSPLHAFIISRAVRNVINARITATRNDYGVYFNDNFVVFEADVEEEAIVKEDGSESLVFTGWVKWGVDDAGLLNFIHMLEAAVPYSTIELTLEYEEPGCECYGKYHYTSGILTVTYIPHENWPEIPDESGSYYDTLERTLELHGVTDRYICKKAELIKQELTLDENKEVTNVSTNSDNSTSSDSSEVV